jgi:hypothetical protein
MRAAAARDAATGPRQSHTALRFRQGHEAQAPAGAFPTRNLKHSPPPPSHCVPRSQWRDSLPLAMQQLLDGTPLTEAGAAVVGVQSSAQEQPGSEAETGAAAVGEAEVTDMAP